MEKKRIEWIDLAKGICILLVMWWHVKELYSNRGLTDRNLPLYAANYFRMPLYFLLSGVFFKTYGGYLDFLTRKTNKLFVPFAVFALLSLAYTLLWPGKLPPHRTLESHYPFVTIWFLWCLFLMNNLFYLFTRLSRGQTPVLYAGVVLAGIIGYCSGKNHIEVLHLQSALTAMPFFVLGHALARHTGFLRARRCWWEALTAVSASALLYLMTLHFGKAGIFYVHNTYEVPLWALYLGGLLGVCAVLSAARLVVRVPVVSYLGRYSIVVLITHYPIIYLFPRHWSVILYRGFGSWCAVEELLLLICVEVPVIALCTHYLPWIFAQKDLIKPKYGPRPERPDTGDGHGRDDTNQPS